MNAVASHHYRPRLGWLRSLIVGLAAAGLIGGCTAAVASPSPTTRAVASPSPTTRAVASPSAKSPSLEPASPTPGPSAASFTTLGVTSNWSGFSWSQLPSDNPLVTADFGVQVLTWRGGYVAYGTTNGESSSFVWTSADGQTWTQATSITAPSVLVAVSPTGLVAMTRNLSATVPSETVWTSSDGLHWHNAGPPAGVAFVDSMAGTSTGLVAVEHTLTGSGKFATYQYSVVFSTDGMSWTPVTVDVGLSADIKVPQVQAGGNRFFVLGAVRAGNASGAIGVVWWSDDGRTWTRSSGTIAWPAISLDFGRDGMLLHTNSLTADGGGVGLVLSTDGGKTWQPDDAFGPLGATVCGQSECSVQPDGAIASNGTVFVAVKSDGHAWVSYDGYTWTPIAWGGPAAASRPLLLMPRGVLVGSAYGAAK
jgi:hypothetical protein